MGRARDFGMGLGVGAGIIGLAMAIAGPATAGPAATTAAARALAAAALAQTIPPPCPGDINGDHMVNAADFTILASNFGSLCTHVDYDLDGQSPDDGDCDDANPTIYLGAPEICDGLDNDCNGQIDDGVDTTSDPQNCGGCGLVCALPNTTYSTCVNSQCMIGACSPGYLDVDNLASNGCETAVGDFDADFDGWAPNQGDCDDNNPNVHPGAQEICNGIDDNCDGQFDVGPAIGCTIYYRDLDSDGFGDPNNFLCLCQPQGAYHATVAGDCNDTDLNVNPGAAEICNNGIDDDCDGLIDNNDPNCL